MKKEITLVDPSSKKSKTVVVSDRPLGPVDVLSIATRGYITSLSANNDNEYPTTAILDRDNALMLSSARGPLKSTTLVSVGGEVTSTYSTNSSSTSSTSAQTSGTGGY